MALCFHRSNNVTVMRPAERLSVDAATQPLPRLNSGLRMGKPAIDKRRLAEKAQAWRLAPFLRVFDFDSAWIVPKFSLYKDDQII